VRFSWSSGLLLEDRTQGDDHPRLTGTGKRLVGMMRLDEIPDVELERLSATE
jgi:hypothetical protein